MRIRDACKLKLTHKCGQAGWTTLWGICLIQLLLKLFICVGWKSCANMTCVTPLATLRHAYLYMFFWTQLKTIGAKRVEWNWPLKWNQQRKRQVYYNRHSLSRTGPTRLKENCRSILCHPLSVSFTNTQSTWCFFLWLTFFCDWFSFFLWLI